MTGGGGGPRIPTALQNIFLSSQKGEDVAKISAPSNGMGFKMFQRRTTGGVRFGNNGKTSSRNRGMIKAPSAASLGSDRSGNTANTDTAADASRKAMAVANNKKEKKKAAIDEKSPQAYLDRMLKERGYSTKKYSSLETGYYCRPTPLQQASYGSRISFGVRSSDVSTVRRLLDAGLSPNPCNNYGESLVHMVCRRGDYKLLRIMLEAGCSLQVTDDYGRCPLHDACWKAEPSFEVVQLILDSDKHLLNLLDCRGAAPLTYVKKENYTKWIDFINSKLDRFFPKRDVTTEGEERQPPLTQRQPHSVPMPDPVHALPLEIASMVANGKMEPEEAIYLDEYDSEEEDDSNDDDSSYDSDDSDDSDDEASDSSSISSDGSDDDFDQEEFAEICLRAGGPMAIAKKCFGGGGGRNVSIVSMMGGGGQQQQQKMA